MEVAFFDRAGRGRLIVTGRDRKDLLHRLATNSLVGLEPGRGISTCFLTNKGRMIDWAVVMDRGDDLLVLSQNPERLAGHILQFTITEDVTVRNYMAIELVVCGPRARDVLGVELEPWCFTDTVLAGVKLQVIRIEPLLGDAYAVLAPDAVALRQELSSGMARALDVYEAEALRVRAGIPAFPNEVNEEHNPWEAGLDAAISTSKGCYIGQEVVARLATYDKVQRRLVRLSLEQPMEAGDLVFFEGREVGTLTTVADLDALAYVKRELAVPGKTLDGARVLDIAGLR